MRRPALIALFLGLALLSQPPGGSVNGQASAGKPVRLVRPVPGSSLLEADAEGLALLRALPPGEPVAPVVVIGPYRSGKSFLLNQLLGVGCTAGFGVGHTRATQTRGVWMWSAPVDRAAFIASAGATAQGDADAGAPREEVEAAATTTTPPRLLFIDTEGFESAGQADAYDDRIFALATVLSSVLVYNLPEALRESDVEKLSFAAQLADALYDTAGSPPGTAAGDATHLPATATTPSPNAVAPGAMVWLIQRDFLGGPSAQEALDAALAAVPNPGGDAGIAAVNGVRAALRVVARTSTAASLAQPHLDRTALCELGDAALAPAYREGRARLKALVGRLASPKLIGGKVLDGPGLAAIVHQLVGALNARDVPSAGAILAHFNRDLGHTVVAEYEAAMRGVPLPATEAGLEAAAASARSAAIAHFNRARFGRAGGGWGGKGGGGGGGGGSGGGGGGAAAGDPLADALSSDLASAWAAARDRNELASSRACTALAVACEDGMEGEARAALPSMGRFAARYAACRSAFEGGCVGPAAADATSRMDKAHDRELGRFTASYNDRLASALTGGALAAIVAGRFVFKVGLLEGLGWAGFAVLQLYPKASWLGGPGGSMYETRWWSGGVVRAWEAVARFPAVWVVVGACAAVAAVVRCGRRVRARAAARRKRGGKGSSPAGSSTTDAGRARRPPGRPTASIASRLLYGNSRAGAAADRDLEV